MTNKNSKPLHQWTFDEWKPHLIVSFGELHASRKAHKKATKAVARFSNDPGCEQEEFKILLDNLLVRRDIYFVAESYIQHLSAVVRSIPEGFGNKLKAYLDDDNTKVLIASRAWIRQQEIEN